MEFIDFKNQIKSKLKNVDEFENTENLLELGLNSLQIMRLVNSWRKQGVKLSFGTLMEDPTLESWWKLIQECDVKTSTTQKQPNELKLNTPFPLTDVQYAYWVGREDGQVLGGVGCHAYLEFTGENIDSMKLQDAWNTVQMHHPMLRARFLENGTQEILETPYNDKMQIHDFSTETLESAQKLLEDVRNGLSHRKLRVEIGEVAGLELSLLPENKSCIHLDVDLLVSDVQSLQILLRDLNSAYLGEELPALSKEFNFAYYLESQNKDDAEDRIKAKNYWDSRLESLPGAPDLPFANRPEQISVTRCNRSAFKIQKNEWDLLQTKAADYKTTPAMMLLTAYALILERWSQNKKFLINIPLFNRKTEQAGLEEVIADFTTLLLLEVNCEGMPTFLEVLERIQSQIHRDMKHTTYSGVEVQRDLAKLHGEQRSNAPIVFACNLGTPLVEQTFRSNLGEFTYMISQTPGVWNDFQTYEDETGVLFTWDTVEELFPEGMIDDMLNSLEVLLHDLIEEDWNKIFDVLPKNQEEQRCNEINKILPLTHIDKLLYSDFVKNCYLNPTGIAIITDNQNITYEQLYNEAMSVASLLLSNGVVTGNYVGITLERGVEQIYAILGILFIGAVYVPINIHQPKERRIKIYEQIGIKYVLSTITTIKDTSLLDDRITVIDLSHKISELTIQSPIEIKSTESAYVIMTSGTTGVPKGVEISHESALNTITDINEKYNVDDSDAVLMVSSIDFDLSVYDIFGMLSSGGKIVVLKQQNYKDPELWLELINKYQISIWNSVPMLFDMLVTIAEGKDELLKLRTVMLSGDWIPITLPHRFYVMNENSVVVAMGGATEASIWSNYLEVPKEVPENWISIPYGKALSNQVYRVLDESNRICPNFVQGELFIGGLGVAKGYKGDKTLTQAKFTNHDGTQWYKTGDYGRTWHDGTIEFLGRKDNQVKIKGYRIELGEIESAISKIIGSSQVKAVADIKRNSIYAFIIGDFDIVDIRIKLSESLIDYMIPDKIIALNEFPINNNQKIDNKALVAIAQKSGNALTKPQFKNDEKTKDILQIYKKHLDCETFDIKSNFFENGGDSLIAIRIATELSSISKKTLKIADIFNYPTVQEIISVIEKGDEVITDNTLSVDFSGGSQLTPIQQSYWINRMRKGEKAYFYVEIKATMIDYERIKICLNYILSKYKIFASNISKDGMEFIHCSDFLNEFEVKKQIFLEESSDYNLSIEYVRNLMLNQNDSIKPIDVSLTSLKGYGEILHIYMDNIFFDATSVILIMNELNEKYGNVLNCTEYSRKPLVKYSAEQYYSAKRYWEQIHLFHTPNIFEKNYNCDKNSSEKLSFSLSEEYEKQLFILSKKHSITVSNIILTIFSKIISIWSNTEQFTINVVLSDNRQEIFEKWGNVADYTTNILHNVEYSIDKSLFENSVALQKRISSDISNMAYGGVKVFQSLRNKQNTPRDNFSVVYTYTLNNKLEMYTDKIGEINYMITRTPEVYLDCQVSKINGNIIISWDYMPSIINQNNLTEMFSLFQETVIAVIENEKNFIDCTKNIQEEEEEGVI